MAASQPQDGHGQANKQMGGREGGVGRGGWMEGWMGYEGCERCGLVWMYRCCGDSGSYGDSVVMVVWYFEYEGVFWYGLCTWCFGSLGVVVVWCFEGGGGGDGGGTVAIISKGIVFSLSFHYTFLYVGYVCERLKRLF